MALRLFPTLAGLTYPVGKTPMWASTVNRSVSGKSNSLGYYSYPIYKIEQSYEFLRSDITNKEFQTLLAFFNLCGGRRDIFAFNDPNNNTATLQQFGSGDGTTKTFQLLSVITGTGGNVWNDPVFQPTGSPSIFKGGVLQATPAQYSIDAYGLVTFVAAPGFGQALTWTGTYNLACRFGDDSASFDQFMNNFWSLNKIIFETEKLP